MIEKIREIMQVDTNTFWAIFVPVILSLISFLRNTINEISNNISWRNRKKCENDFFYCLILLYALIAGYMTGVICVILRVFMDDMLLLLVCLFGLLIIAISFINTRKYVKLRLLGIYPMFGKALIDIPVIVMSVIFCLSVMESKVGVVENICSVIFWVCEIIGICVFRKRLVFQRPR